MRRLRWQIGAAGNANIVTFDGDDIVGVATVQFGQAERLIAQHNALLDELDALERRLAEPKTTLPEKYAIQIAPDLDPIALAEKLGDLRYDALSDYLLALSQKLRTDGVKDSGRGRKQLTAKLFAAATLLVSAHCRINEAWKICKPHMHEKDK